MIHLTGTFDAVNREVQDPFKNVLIFHYRMDTFKVNIEVEFKVIAELSMQNPTSQKLSHIFSRAID